MNRIINFIKYHNAFVIGLGVVLLITASVLAASENARNVVIGKKIVEIQGVDNSQLLSADLDNFDFNLQIINVNEDEDNYYVDYKFNTLALKDNVWQKVTKTKRLTVSKQVLGNRDLGLYLQEELGEVIDYELAYLKKAQAIERSKGRTTLTASVKYTGLIGLVLDVKNKILPSYEPVVQEELPPQITGEFNPRPPETFQVAQVSEGSSPKTSPCQPTAEICDGLDNDCDEEIDEGGVCFKEESVEEGRGEEEVKEEVGEEVKDEVEEEVEEETEKEVGEELGEGVGEGVVEEEFTEGNIEGEEVEEESVGSEGGKGVEEEVIEGEGDEEMEEGEGEVGSGEMIEEEISSTCDIEHLELCSTQELCEKAGFYWYNEICNLEPKNSSCQPIAEICDDGIDNDCDEKIDEEDEDCQVGLTVGEEEEVGLPVGEEKEEEPDCNSENLDACTTQELCEEANLYWYDGKCHTEPEPSPCVPDWQCVEWEPLPETVACGQEFTQTCANWVDNNNCGLEETPTTTRKAIGTNSSTCGVTSCDPEGILHLVGECQNTCVEGSCQNCVPICTCAEGYLDCNGDGTGSDADGCEFKKETPTSTCPNS